MRKSKEYEKKSAFLRKCKRTTKKRKKMSEKMVTMRLINSCVVANFMIAHIIFDFFFLLNKKNTLSGAKGKTKIKIE